MRTTAMDEDLKPLMPIALNSADHFGLMGQVSQLADRSTAHLPTHLVAHPFDCPPI